MSQQNYLHVPRQRRHFSTFPSILRTFAIITRNLTQEGIQILAGILNYRDLYKQQLFVSCTTLILHILLCHAKKRPNLTQDRVQIIAGIISRRRLLIPASLHAHAQIVKRIP